jgi:hypothetical protein
MSGILDALCRSAALQPGDRVRTFRGSMRGVIVRVEPDGRVTWRTDAGTELVTLPEALLPEPAS